MEEMRIDVQVVKSVFKEVGLKEEECNRCMEWISKKTEKPLTREDMVLAKLTPGEEGFLRCMDYMFEEKVVDTVRLRTLYETFWSTVRDLHDLPPSDLAVKEGKYIVAE